jgi:glycosyltransferase involved in cell wall biosynthesis
MRVLYWVDSAAAKTPGGHCVQFEQTNQHIQELGVDTVVCTHGRPDDLSGFDIVHGYGLNVDDVKYCKSKNKDAKVVISTIYWSSRYDYPYAEQNLLTDLRKFARKTKLGLRLFRSALTGDHKAVCLDHIAYQYALRATFDAADLLLPNAHGEAALVASELGTTTPQRVVVNGVNHKLFTYDRTQPDSEYVLYCARFEPHKNQLGLIKAMQSSSLPLVLVGAEHKGHPEYYKRCHAEAAKGKNIKILPAVQHHELPRLYQGAKVHAMPSFFETTGLVSLEAALSGCNVVAGNRGYAREYFEGDAWWCDPYKAETIRNAVERAFETPFNHELRERILRKYTWEQTARQTLAAYEDVLAGSNTNYSYDQNLASLTLV